MLHIYFWILYAKTMVKKLILLGFALCLLVGLPLAIFVLQNQSSTTVKSGAAAATKFTFDVSSLPQINVGQNFDVPIDVDPQGQNQVSFIKVAFTYDGTKLNTQQNPPITINSAPKSNTQYTTLEAPQVTCNSDSTSCQGSFTISIGSSTQDVITTKTAVATIHFIAKANTDPNTPTQLTFVSGQNQALSVASTDQPAENVFQSGTPASITIGSSSSSSSGGSTSSSSSGSSSSGSSSGGSSGSSSSGGSSGSSSSGSSSSGSSGGGSSVTCTSLTADVTSGPSPLSVTFTAVGTSSTDTISSLALNYGDGNVDQVATGSGIGTSSVNAQQSHTYQQNGTFTASATFTTNTGATNPSTSCQTTITVGANPTSNPTGSTPKPTLPPTGPGNTLLFAGAGGAILTVVGFAILLGL